MSRILFEDRVFTGGELSPADIAGAEFDHCTFRSVQWMAVDMSNTRFTDCTFEQCDLSNAIVDDTGFRSVVFKGCKLLGVQFERCSKFLLAVHFDQCRMDFVSFRSVTLKAPWFRACSLVEADFSGSDMRKAVFEGSLLTGAVFDNTNLEGADLREARGLILDPERNRIKGARFALSGLPGLLTRYRIEVE